MQLCMQIDASLTVARYNIGSVGETMVTRTVNTVDILNYESKKKVGKSWNSA